MSKKQGKLIELRKWKKIFLKLEKLSGKDVFKISRFYGNPMIISLVPILTAVLFTKNNSLSMYKTFLLKLVEENLPQWFKPVNDVDVFCKQ